MDRRLLCTITLRRSRDGEEHTLAELTSEWVGEECVQTGQLGQTPGLSLLPQLLGVSAEGQVLGYKEARVAAEVAQGLRGSQITEERRLPPERPHVHPTRSSS